MLVASCHGGDLVDWHVFGSEYFWIHVVGDQICSRWDHRLLQGQGFYGLFDHARVAGLQRFDLDVDEFRYREVR